MSDGALITLPVLPLRDIVVFPHMIVPLFVGREKSTIPSENRHYINKAFRPHGFDIAEAFTGYLPACFATRRRDAGDHIR